MKPETSPLKSLGRKAQDFWLKNEQKIILVFGLILVAGISFALGVLQSQKWQATPLIIEKTAAQEACKSDPVNLNTTSENGLQNANSEPKKDCAFTGSKNSNKYHVPTCRWAKQIKPENVVCFKSVEDAVARNYQPDKNCIK